MYYYYAVAYTLFFSAVLGKLNLDKVDGQWRLWFSHPRIFLAVLIGACTVILLFKPFYQ